MSVAEGRSNQFIAVAFFSAFSAQKSHVKPQSPPTPKIKLRKSNKQERLHSKNKSAKFGILVSLDPLK
jgi:hypothetical protein